MQWMTLLQAAVAATSKAQVAETLGVSRTVVSLIAAGKYPAKTDRFAARVMEAYGKVICPFLDAEISMAACKEYHTGATPTSSPRAMRHWRACQTCAHNPNNQRTS